MDSGLPGAPGPNISQIIGKTMVIVWENTQISRNVCQCVVRSIKDRLRQIKQLWHTQTFQAFKGFPFSRVSCI